MSKISIVQNEQMSKHTSFKVGGMADYFCIVSNESELVEALNFAKEKSIPIYVIGNGTNLLVTDKGFRGIVIKIEINNIEIQEENSTIYVIAGAGVKVMALAQILKEKEISGFEELAGIPGTIGGANYMNAGAHGKEMKDIIVETKVLNKETNEIEILKKEEQSLSYRSSIFKRKKYIILETKMKFSKGKKEQIEQKMQEYQTIRKAKQPLEYPSAGSTFKRGEGYITAKLIDDCGLKGYQIGGAQISEKHAGFIINKENATAKDIIDLIKYTKKKVFEEYGINIIEEIEIIGEE